MLSMSTVRKHFWQRRQPLRGRLLDAEEVRLERVHARADQQRRRIVARHERRRGQAHVAALLEEGEEALADLVGGHAASESRLARPRPPPPRRGLSPPAGGARTPARSRAAWPAPAGRRELRGEASPCRSAPVLPERPPARTVAPATGSPASVTVNLTLRVSPRRSLRGTAFRLQARKEPAVIRGGGRLDAEREDAEGVQLAAGGAGIEPVPGPAPRGRPPSTTAPNLVAAGLLRRAKMRGTAGAGAVEPEHPEAPVREPRRPSPGGCPGP